MLLQEGEGCWNLSGQCSLYRLKTQNLSLNVLRVLYLENDL